MGAVLGATTARDRFQQWLRESAAPLRAPAKYVIPLAIAGAIALAVAYFDWNWFRGPLAEYLSARLGRPVTIEGDIGVDLSMRPLVTADSVVVGNATWATDPTMARLARAAVRLEPLS